MRSQVRDMKDNLTEEKICIKVDKYANIFV
jgi:hypothetical protein